MLRSMKLKKEQVCVCLLIDRQIVTIIKANAGDDIKKFIDDKYITAFDINASLVLNFVMEYLNITVDENENISSTA